MQNLWWIKNSLTYHQTNMVCWNAKFRSFYSQGGSACSRDYTPWVSVLNDDECEREILGTPTAEVSQENSEELQWVQTLSSRSLEESTHGTAA